MGIHQTHKAHPTRRESKLVMAGFVVRIGSGGLTMVFVVLAFTVVTCVEDRATDFAFSVATVFSFDISLKG